MLPCHGGTVWIWAGRQGTGGSRASHPPPWPPWTLGPCTPLTPRPGCKKSGDSSMEKFLRAFAKGR